MKVLVTVKHVPDTTEVRFDEVGTLLVRQAPTKINDYDRNALEVAAQLRESRGAEVIVACVGPTEASKTLKEALAFGGASAALVVPPEPVDSAGAAMVLAALAEHEGPFDLVLSGDVSEDGYDGLVPALLAAQLDWPVVRGATGLEFEGDSLRVTRTADDVEEVFAISGPAVVSVTRMINVPRTITTMQVMKVPMSKVRQVDPADLGVPDSAWNTESRAVRVLSTRPATTARAQEMLSGEPDEVVRALLTRLGSLGVLS